MMNRNPSNSPRPGKSLLTGLFLLSTLLAAEMLPAQPDQAAGYDLWLRFRPVEDKSLASEYRQALEGIWMRPEGATQQIVWDELTRGLGTLLSQPLQEQSLASGKNLLVVGTQSQLPEGIRENIFKEEIPEEGFLIREFTLGQSRHLVLTAGGDKGLLYGAYRLLRWLQMERPITGMDLQDAPKTALRMLNHWDNLDRTVERGYAGASIWNWHTLPGYIDPRYIDYARANASLGINATVVTNVNANALVLTAPYLEKARALAEVMRPYGIRLFLTARFSAPMEVGGLPTADPLDPAVIAWWKGKTDTIYSLIPDFGGFVVKANSEGQPGPQNYGRSHLEGANALAEALAPHGGLLIWRAFVYSENDPTDRAKQAYVEFMPHDGQFRDNVLLQVKNGPIDFQPREPVHPLFGAMKHTPLVMEFQITKEYLGFATHLVYLPRLFEEVLQTDTWQQGEGSTVARVVNGSLYGHSLSGMAGVSNIGSDLNWTGHPFGQADWYGFGRLAWDPDLQADTLAEEWIRSTLGNDPELVGTLKALMLDSREAVVSYMMPLGLHHLFDTGHHYGPGPWVGNLSRPEWNPVYYHQADANGIGFDRSPAGSDAASQYAGPLASEYGNAATCPEELLLWFHHLPWDYRMKNGTTLWEALGLKYQEGVDAVRNMIRTWESLQGKLDAELYRQVHMLLAIQLREARWWKDACMSYFQTFSKLDFPGGMEPPEHSLDYYQSLRFPYAPGIRPGWH